MEERKDEFRTPFVAKPVHCPAFLDNETRLPRVPTREEYFEWLRGDGLKVYQRARDNWMAKNRYDKCYSSLLLCENLDHSYEAIRVQSYIWDIYVWAYSTMNINEHLSPLIAVNSDGYRKLPPTQGDGHRKIISAKVRSLLANALGMKNLKYVAYRNTPRDPMRDGVFLICVEGLLEAQKKRERLDPEVLYIGMQMGTSFGPGYRKLYKERFVDVVNGQLRNRPHWNNVKEWLGRARTSLFRMADRTNNRSSQARHSTYFKL